MKSTDCNADMVWPQVGLPKHRRSARRAKMHPNLSSLLPVANIDVGRSFGANMLLLEKGNNAEHRTSSPLTLATMAGTYGIRIGRHFDTQGTTRTMRDSRHLPPPLSKSAARISIPQTVGRIFALSRNRFVGSYRFFNDAKRSKFAPYADLTRSSSSLIASSTALTYALGS
jgi:hypothetical protein